jgi:cytochrome c-type biogenesis protein CcmH
MARLILLFGLLFTPAHALDPGEALADAVLESRARALSQELRCMVCQNQSIDDSDAPLAKDLRQFVRARLLAGDSDTDIRAAVVERYGEFALFRPRLAPHTIALWAMPLFILLFGGVMAWRVVGKSARQNTSTPRQ